MATWAPLLLTSNTETMFLRKLSDFRNRFGPTEPEPSTTKSKLNGWLWQMCLVSSTSFGSSSGSSGKGVVVPNGVVPKTVVAAAVVVGKPVAVVNFGVVGGKVVTFFVVGATVVNFLVVVGCNVDVAFSVVVVAGWVSAKGTVPM